MDQVAPITDDVLAYEAEAEIRQRGGALTAWSGRKRVGAIRVERGGVFVDGSLEVPSSEIGEVFYSRDGDEHILHLLDAQRRPTMDLVVADAETATALLAPLANTRRTRFAVDVRVERSRNAKVGFAAFAAIWVTASLLWPVGIQSALLLFLVAALPLLIVFGVLTRSWLELGSDGMLLATRGRQRFVRYDAVSSVEAVDAKKLHVKMRDGAPVELELAGRGRAALPGPSGSRDALLVHLRAALRAAGATDQSGSLARRIGRRGRPREAWLADIASLRDGDSSYRETALRDADLWDIVESASAPEDARAAAALLLRSTEDGAAARARLRVAADAVVSKKLRIAIEAAAGSDDAAAEEALEEVTDESSAEPRHLRASQD